MKHPTQEWKWFGLSGHCIIGRWCRFHLATQVGPWLISTIGLYVHPQDSMGNEQDEAKYLIDNPDGETLGHERHYETMVFLAGKPCETKRCGGGMPAIGGNELFAKGYENAGDATRGHLAACKMFAKRGKTP